MNYFTKRKILHFFFPNRCPICSDILNCNDKFCEKCAENINYYEGRFNINSAASFNAVYVYNDNISPAIFLLKDGIGGNADYALGGELAELLMKKGVNADLIIPVPMTADTVRKRGYNQSILIGRQLERIMKIPLHTDIVSKIRSTSAQKTLSHEERLVNLKNAFEVIKPELIHEKSVILTDDVCTTGSTLAEITSVLIKSGAKEVHCAVLCKTPLKGISKNPF